MSSIKITYKPVTMFQGQLTVGCSYSLNGKDYSVSVADYRRPGERRTQTISRLTDQLIESVKADYVRRLAKMNEERLLSR